MSRDTEYQFVPTDSSAIVARLISAYENMTGRTLQPADPDRLFIAWVANVIIQERVNQNYTGNQNIPSRSSGADLDALGEFIYGIKRLGAQSSKCNMRFYITKEQSSVILIPSGTRVTDTSGKVVWHTTDDAVIDIGSLYSDVMVQCDTPGSAGNGYIPGQINKLIDVDNIQYFDRCENTETSDGGSEEASDEEYYNLMKAGLDAYSTAGPTGAYIYRAKTVSTNIADVKAILPMEEISEIHEVMEHKGDKLIFVSGRAKSEEIRISFDGTDLSSDDYIITSENDMYKVTLTDEQVNAGDSLTVTYKREMAGNVYIYALMDDGSIADEILKKGILAACSADYARPLTDKVTVCNPVEFEYDIDIEYYISKKSGSSAREIEEKVIEAVGKYKEWQKERLGRDINPSYLAGLLMKTGIKRFVIKEPQFTVLPDGSDGTAPGIANKTGNESIVNRGYEDE